MIKINKKVTEYHSNLSANRNKNNFFDEMLKEKNKLFQFILFQKFI